MKKTLISDHLDTLNGITKKFDQISLKKQFSAILLFASIPNSRWFDQKILL